MDVRQKPLTEHDMFMNNPNYYILDITIHKKGVLFS